LLLPRVAFLRQVESQAEQLTSRPLALTSEFVGVLQTCAEMHLRGVARSAAVVAMSGLPKSIPQHLQRKAKGRDHPWADRNEEKDAAKMPWTKLMAVTGENILTAMKLQHGALTSGF
jgi:hypothetical protein